MKKKLKAAVIDETPEIDTTPAPEAESEKPPRKKLSKKKTIILCSICGLLIAGTLSILFLYILNNPNVNPMLQKNGILGMYGNTKTYIHYPIDHNYDIMSDLEYLDLDRRLYLKLGSETIAVDEYPKEDMGEDVLFFVNYFDLAIAGDYNAYNKLFTDNYYKYNEPYSSFTMQMIYDMNVEKLGESTADGETVYYYNVSYKIHKNNGTFRNDIGSDGCKTLHFTLIKKDGKILIDSIKYYY